MMEKRVNSDMVYRSLLAHGRENPIKASVLAHELQTSLRDINEMVRRLRKSGVMVGSRKEPPYGYYIPGSDEEIAEYLSSFRAELFDMLRTFQRQRRASREYVDSRRTRDLFSVTKTGQLEMIVG